MNRALRRCSLASNYFDHLFLTLYGYYGYAASDSRGSTRGNEVSVSFGLFVLGPMRRNSSHLQGGVKKWGHRLMTAILSILDRFKKITGRRLGNKFVVKWIF